MARVAIPHIALKPDPTNANALIPASGASVTVRRRSDSALATVYQAETGAATVANPLATDANGRVSGWVDRGAYTVTITGTGITMPPDQWDAAPAGDNTVDVPWLAGAAVPVGSIFIYAAAGDPAGGNWLACDGRALSRTTYAALFAAIGTTFGAGDGSTTFAIPDLRSRSPIGAGQGTGLTNRALGGKLGEESHTLTTTEMPAHAHGVTDPTHAHSISDPGHAHNIGVGGRSAGAANTVAIGDATGRTGAVTPGGGIDASGTGIGIFAAGTGVAIQNAGGGGAHNVVHPSLVLNFIIRAL